MHSFLKHQIKVSKIIVKFYSGFINSFFLSVYERSSPDENSPQTMIEMDVSSSVICSESVADSVARIVDGLRHSVGEGNSSCASSDSLSSLSFASITGMVICGEK